MQRHNAPKSILKKLFASNSGQRDIQRRKTAFFSSQTSAWELETRQLLATFNYSAQQLTIETDSENEVLSIAADTSSGNYTIQSNVNFTNLGSSIGGIAGEGTPNLTVYSNLSLSNIIFQDNASNSGSSFYFGTSNGNFITNLTVNFQNATSGSIQIANDTTFINSSQVSLTTAGGSVAQQNPLSANGSGTASYKARNIEITANLLTESGNITIDADNGWQQAGDFDGIRFLGANISSTSGDILIKGRNGDGTSFGYGVVIDSTTISTQANGTLSIYGNTSNNSNSNQYGIHTTSATLLTENGNVLLSGNSSGTSMFDIGAYLDTSTITISGNGSFTLLGTSGTGNGGSEYGILLNVATVTVSSGNISIQGISRGSDIGTNDYGVYITGGSYVTLLDTGKIDIDGTSGSGSGGNEVGIQISGSPVLLTNGPITITGNSHGQGSNDYGISLVNSGSIQISGSGNISLNGTSGNGAGGGEIGIVIDSACVTTANGSISINGTSRGTSDTDTGVLLIYTASQNPEVRVDSADNISITGSTANASALAVNISNGSITSNGGQIILTGNSIYLDPDALVNATSAGSVSIHTLGTGIMLGDDNSTSNLGLTQAVLDRITAGTLSLGNANAPNIRVNQSISWGSNLSLTTPGNITQATANSLTVSGLANFTAGQTIQLANSTNNFTTLSAQAGNITIVDQDDLQLASVNATGFLAATSASGNISQTTNGILVGAYTSLTAATGNITLDTASGNDFAGNITATSNTIRIRNSNASLLGVVSATDLTVNSTGGAITQVSGTSLAVTGTANFVTTGSGTAGNIILSNTTNNFGTFTANGTNITFYDANDVTISAVNATGDFTVQLDDTVSCISVTGPIDSTGGSGNVTLSGRNIVVTGNISSGAGDINLFGNGGGSYQAGTFDGVCISGSGVNVNTTSGNITIDGRGGAGSVNAGVNITSANVNAAGAGNVTITGISGNGSTNNAYGVYGSAACVTSVNGLVSVNGTGCGTGTDTRGVQIDAFSTVSATGSGNVNITGIALNGTTGTGGVLFANVTVNSGNGNISIQNNNLNIGFGIETTGANVTVIGNGSISLNAKGGNVIDSGTHACGVAMFGGSLLKANNGSITINSNATDGTVADGGSKRGIYLYSGSIEADGVGNIVITGTGGASNGSSSRGVSLYDFNVTANGTGCIVITGIGSTGVNGSSQYGVLLGGTSSVSTASGDIQITGNGGDGEEYSFGFYSYASTSVISGGAGNLTITGRGGSNATAGNRQIGIGLYNSAILRANGSGTVTLDGSGGAFSGTRTDGIFLNGGSSSSPQISSSSGAVILKGVNGANSSAFGVTLFKNGNVSTSSNVTITSNSLYISANSVVNATSSGTVLIQTQGAGVDLGGEDDSANLGLTNTELGQITANLLTIGNSTTGAIVNTDAISLAGNLTLVSGNSITQSGAGNLTITGTANFISGGSGINGNITLSNVTNDFGTFIASGTNITVTDATGIEFGTVTATGDLTANGAAGAITQATDATLAVTGTANFVTTGSGNNGNITLANASNDFGRFVASGTNITVTDATGIEFGAVTATSNLTANGVAGAITQASGTFISVSVAANFVTTGSGTAGNLTLNEPSNDFATVTASGTNITINDTNALTLESISGNGTVQITAQNVTITGTISATSTGSVILLPTAGTMIDLGTKSTGNFGLTSTEINNITAQTLTIGNTTSGAVWNTAPISRTNATLGTNFNVFSGGSITQTSTGNLAVAGSANFLTAGPGNNGNITLNNATNDFNTVAVTGTNITIADSNDLALDSISGNGTIQIEAANLTINSSVNATASGTVILLPLADAIVDLGSKSTGNFGLTQAEINQITSDTLVIGNITSNSIINTDAINWSGNLTLVSGISITQSGGNLAVAGTANFISAGDIYVDSANNNLTTVTACGSSIYLTNANALTVGDMSGSLDIVLTASEMTIQGMVNATTSGGVRLVPTAGLDVDLGTKSSGNFSLSNTEINRITADALTIGNAFDTGNITITSNIIPLGVNTFNLHSYGDISETGAGKLVITGNFSSLAAGNVSLNNATNLFSGLVGVTGNVTSIVNSGPTQLDSLNMLGDFSLTSSGDVTQTTSVISIAGNTNISATGYRIILDATTNLFEGNISASGSDISLADQDAIVLGSINATGNLSVIVLANAITQTSAGVVVSGNTTLTALGNSITLDQSTNNFSGNVSASGSDIALTDIDAIELGAISSTGNLTVVATAGTITQTSAGIAVAANTSLTATGNAITLNASANDYVGNISATGSDISLRNSNATMLGTISATSLTVNSTGGAISQVSGTGLSVAGLATFTAIGNNVNISETTNDFQNLTATALNLTLADANNLTLSNINIGNTVNITTADQVNLSGTCSAAATLLQVATLNSNQQMQTALTINSGTANLASASNITGATILNGGNLTNAGRLSSTLMQNNGTASLAATSNVSGAATINNGTFTNAGRLSGIYTQNNGTANMQTGAVVSGLATLAGGSLTSNATFNGGLTATGGTLYTLHNGTTTTNLNFGAASVWNANGSSLTDFGTITANGSVTIASGANLTLAVPPMLCNQSITLINKTSSGAVSGSFSGLAQGTFFSRSGMPLAISYTAGTGNNDVVVTDTPRLMIITGGNNQTAASGAQFGSNLTIQVMGGAANETPVNGANVIFQLPVQVTNCNIASGYFNSVNNVANLTANVLTDSNGNASLSLSGGINSGPFNVQPVVNDFRGVYNTYNLGVVGLAVQKQSVNRSFVRYLDLVLTDPSSIPDLTALNSNIVLQKVKSASLTGGANITPVNITLTATNAVKTTVGWMFDFGTAGIGGNGADTTTDDGVYQFANATGSSNLPTTYRFHRLLGDVNGDKVVDAADTALVNTLVTSPAWRYNNANTPIAQGNLFYVATNAWAGDANGDGRVNATDINITGRWRGRRVTY